MFSLNPQEQQPSQDIRLAIFWPYLIIPTSIILFFIDYFFLKNSIKNTDLLTLFPFVFIFKFPHIVQSFYPLFQKEYIKNYAKKNIIGLLYVLCVTSALLKGPITFYVLFMAATTGFHVTRQQVGTLFLTSKKPMQGAVRNWALYFTFFSTALYTIATTNTLFHFSSILTHILGASITLLAFYSYMTYKKANFDETSRQNFLFVSGSIFITLIFLISGYGLLAFFITRFIHDFTAFTLYALRDIVALNKKINTLSFIQVSIYPISAMFFCFFVITKYYHNGLFLVTSLTLYHYYTESYLWKRTTLNAQYLKKALLLD